MKGKLFVILAGIAPLFASAQWLENPFLRSETLQSEKKNTLVAEYGYDVASTAVTNRFFNDYQYTPFLEEDVKNTVLSKLRDKNYFGGYTDRQLLYRWTSKKNDSRSYYIGAKARDERGLVFKPDVYRVMMYGNKAYENKMAVFDHSAYVSQAYQSLQGGMMQRQTLPTGTLLEYGIGLSLVKGGPLVSIGLEKGSLYTGPDGDSIYVVAKGKAATAGKFVEPWYSGTGAGAGLSGFFRWKPKGKNTYALAVSDLGFIHYSSTKGGTYAFDESFAYTGEDMTHFDFDAGISGNHFIVDSLKERALSLKKKEGFSKPLPMQAQALWRHDISPEWRTEAGFEYVFFVHSRPQLYALAGWKMHTIGYLSGGIQAFGFGHYGFIFTAEAEVKSVKLRIGTANLEAWIASQSSTTAQSAFGELSVSF